MKAKIEPTERELLEAETAELSRRETEAYEKLNALKARLAAVDGEASSAAARGDGAALAALEAELDVLPARLRIAEAGVRGIAALLAEKAARLGELNREVLITRLDSERIALVNRGEQSAAALAAALLATGKLVTERIALCAEVDDFRRTLAQYDLSMPPLPDFRSVAETTVAAAKSGGRFDSLEVRVPVRY